MKIGESTPPPSRGIRPPATAATATSPGSSALVSSLFASTVPGTPIPGTSMVTLAQPRACTLALIHGFQGCGKTNLVTRFCPDPVVLINCDRRGEETTWQAMETGRTVHYLDAALPAEIVNYSPEDAKAVANHILHEKIIPDFQWSIDQATKGNIRTIGIDTSTEFTRMLNYALRGHPVKQKPTKDDPGDFGASDRAINEYIWFFLNKARECRKVNLIILARSKEDYDGPVPLGTFSPDCHKIFHQAVDWSAYLSMSTEEEMVARLQAESGTNSLTTSQLRKVKTRRPFELKVTKGGQRVEELGKVYTEAEWGEDGPFAYAASRLIPRTTVEDWK